MNMLANLTYDENISHETDSTGGYFVFDSDLYAATVKCAYLQKAKSGALGLHLVFNINDNEYKETLYVSNRNGENFYKDKQGNKHYLIGFNHADALAAFTCKKPLSALETENKVVKLYNYETKSEVPTEVPMITEMLGKPVKLGIIKKKEFKQAKDSDGNYVDTDETREINNIDKVFRDSDNKTTAELRAKVGEAEFYKNWLSKWQGVVKDTTGNKQPSKASQQTSSKPVSSLFSD